MFFGEPEIDTAEFLRVASDGRGIISLLEVPGVADKPALYSTFLMWLLADLFNDLPEVGDLDKPKLVFFFDEAHLLFNDASKDFLAADHADRAAHPLEGRRRLLRHADPEGRARPTCSPSSARACSTSCARSRPTTRRPCARPCRRTRSRATTSRRCSPTLGTGEAIVTVMNEKGAPIARRLDAAARAAGVDVAVARCRRSTPPIAASPLLAKYGTGARPRVGARDPDRRSSRMPRPRSTPKRTPRPRPKADAEYAKMQAEDPEPTPRRPTRRRRPSTTGS